jgi:CubicO group peptidase (beta-lactamase class C family)
MRPLLPLLLLALSACARTAPEAAPPPPAGTSYAWVTFDQRRIRDSGAVGLADRAAGRALTVDDPVRVASISKLAVAMGVMRLVEQGRLDLDADVSGLLGWRLRNPTFPDVPITLRLLLSHRSSLTDDADYVVPLGKDVESVVRDPGAFDADHAPGTHFRYANLGFPIIASVMEKATGERFDRLMHRLVLQPLGLDACFNWSTCSDARMARAVVLYDLAGAVVRDDLKGQRPNCPVVSVSEACDLAAYHLGSNGAIFSPQGGLRASARDLAALGQVLLSDGRHGGRQFLSRSSMDAITGAAWRYDGANGNTEDGFYCSYGLGTQILPVEVNGCSDDLFGDGRKAIGHAGEAYGVRSGLWVDKARGVGIAFFAANNGPDPAKGRSAYRAVEEFLAAKLKS